MSSIIERIGYAMVEAMMEDKKVATIVLGRKEFSEIHLGADQLPDTLEEAARAVNSVGFEVMGARIFVDLREEELFGVLAK